MIKSGISPDMQNLVKIQTLPLHNVRRTLLTV